MEINIHTLLRERITPAMRRARLFYEDDHWQRGAGLIIKKPLNQPDVLRQMEEGFASQNKTAEVVDRRTDGILGREPAWSILPKSQQKATKAQQSSIEEMAAAIVEWWNKRNILGLMREAHTNAALERRAILRPFVPSAFKVAGRVTQVKTFAAALDLLHFENVSPENAGVFLEEHSLRPFSIYKTERRERTEIDFSFVDADGTTHFKTFVERDFEKFVKDEFPTLARYITTPTGRQQIGEYSISLGGKLMLYELDFGQPMIDKAFQSKQMQYNLSLTMKGRNTWTAGFRERHFLNADEPEELNLGAGSATYHQGAPVIDAEGKIIGIANPSIVVVDPVDPANFIKSEASLDLQMLAEVDQRHVGMADDATASGKSRIEAREEFRATLVKSKLHTDAHGRYLVEFAMMFAAALTGRTAEYEPFRCNFDSIINAGRPTPEEMKANREACEAGEISLETLRSRNGIEDTDAEDSKVKSEAAYEITRFDKVLDVLNKAGNLLTLEEKRRLLYPEKSDEETAADLKLLASEAGVYEEI